MKKFFLIITCILVFSCNRKEKIDKISIYYIGCLGECPQIKIEIDANHKIKYFGDYFSGKRGFYEGTIDATTWNKIEDFLRDGNYENLDDSYYLTTNEEIDIELVINSKKVNKRVKGLITSFPPEIRKMLEFVLKDISNWKMSSTKKELKFDFKSDDPITPKFLPSMPK